MRFLELHQAHATMEQFHKTPVWVNLDLVTNICQGAIHIQHTPEQKSTPWHQLPKTPITYICFAGDNEGQSTLMVLETPEEIFTLERNTR